MRRKSIVSDILLSGFSNGIPFQPSMIRSEEAPMPSAKRPPRGVGQRPPPPARAARGPRCITPTTPVPSRTFSVQAAPRASGVKPSGPFVSPRPEVGVAGRLGALVRARALSASATPVSGTVSPQRCMPQRDPIREFG